MKYKIWCDGCSGTGYRKSCVCEGKGYTKKDLVEFDPDESLPLINIELEQDLITLVTRVVFNAKIEAQQDMLNANYRKVKL